MVLLEEYVEVRWEGWKRYGFCIFVHCYRYAYRGWLGDQEAEYAKPVTAWQCPAYYK